MTELDVLIRTLRPTKLRRDRSVSMALQTRSDQATPARIRHHRSRPPNATLAPIRKANEGCADCAQDRHGTRVQRLTFVRSTGAPHQVLLAPGRTSRVVRCSRTGPGL